MKPSIGNDVRGLNGLRHVIWPGLKYARELQRKRRAFMGQTSILAGVRFQNQALYLMLSYPNRVSAIMNGGRPYDKDLKSLNISSLREETLPPPTHESEQPSMQSVDLSHAGIKIERDKISFSYNSMEREILLTPEKKPQMLNYIKSKLIPFLLAQKVTKDKNPIVVDRSGVVWFAGKKPVILQLEEGLKRVNQRQFALYQMLFNVIWLKRQLFKKK